MKPDSSKGVNLKVPPQIAAVTALHKDHLELTHNQSVDEQPRTCYITIYCPTFT